MNKKIIGLITIFSALLITDCSLQIKSLSGTPDQQNEEQTVQSAQNADVEYWDEITETLTAPSAKPAVKEAFTIFDNDFPKSGFGYVYGGKTADKVQPTTSKNNPGVLGCYLDNNDYSGVTVALGAGSSIDIENLRNAKAAGLAFWAKARPGVSSIYIGIIDDDSDTKKVQTKVSIVDYGKLDTNWNYFMIPLRKFQTAGKYWDDNKKAEILADVDWKKINEIRFSNNKGENKPGDGKPVAFYIDQVAFIENIPGYVDPEEYWASFKSDVPNVMLTDFENSSDNLWEASNGPKSTTAVEYIKSTAKNGGQTAMQVTYKMTDWCDAVYSFKTHNSAPQKRDWSKFWGIKFDIYSSKPFQPINVQIADGSDEIWLASAGGQKGWTEVLVPFKAFYKFPYWQPPEAIQNGKLDLQDVISIDFKPSGDGTSGSFIIDNVRLTNEREAFVAPVAESVPVTISGDLNKVVTPSINSGLFGINAALWDGDMFTPKTDEYVKAVNHSVIRYPGGLRADEDHWKEVLAKKDFMVDIDEFLDFCAKTNTTPMITVNFGTGTPQEAADWVKHCNVDKKANVKYWEVGNELYGDWHANHCTAEEYGKRAAEFIKAMKAVDPSIFITTVWVLEGEWNKKVFEYTKELADGVNIHHYPQHAGEENDAGLLSAPQTLDGIIPGVRKQLAEAGVPGKKYQIWLTEWNSVDFKPGPQTLGIVNALFVADYLGMLTKNNIEQASYWDIHNDMTEQGGDYGYLSRTGAPDGNNVPRPSYWAFKLTSETLRGKLVETKSPDDNITAYLAVNKGKKSLLLVNKYPKTKANISFSIPGFKGKGTVNTLSAENAKNGYSTQPIELKDGGSISVPGFSITAITIE